MVYPVANSKLATIEKVKWQDIKIKVAEANSPFAKVIDQMVAAGYDFPLYVARYPFGSEILNSGSINLPTPEGGLAPIHDARISSELRENLGCNLQGTTVPMGLILTHSAELFMQPGDRILPFGLIKKGKIFALWGVLNPSLTYGAPNVWHIVAGARSLFMLPKITDATSYKKLAKARGLKLPLPRRLLNQGPVMAQMAKHRNFADSWHTEVLFFPMEWLKARADDAWIRFHHFLLQEGWNATEYWRNKVVYDFVWDSFVKGLAKEGIKANSIIIDIVKHLIILGLGVLPGFSPALDDESGPIKALQTDFVEIYGVKQFSPTIMVPRHFSLDEPSFIYWSLQLPTYFESSPRLRTETSALSDLRDIQALLERFLQAVLKGSLEGISNTPIHDFAKNVKYDFFHSESDNEAGIRPSKEMPNEDKNLVTNSFQLDGFSYISPFVRGCVRVSIKK